MHRSQVILLASLVLATTSVAQDVETFGMQDNRMPNPAKPAFRPYSAVAGLDVSLLPTVALPSVDLVALGQQDAFAESGGAVPLRVGIVRDARLRDGDGVWSDLGDGRWLWVAEIRAIDAIGLRLHFANVEMPRGASLVAYAPYDPARVAGPFDGRGPLDQGSAWTPTLFGDVARVEYLVPGEPGVQPTLGFALTEVLHVYREPSLEAQPEGACYVDSSCVSGISTLRNAVGRISYVENGGGYLCTGQLLRTTAGDLTPYFQTAEHCIGSNAVANTAEIYWRYQSTTCDGTVPSIGDVSSSVYCSLLATQSTSDSSMLLVQGALPSGLTWAGWTSAVQAIGTPGIAIHHPQGNPKKASTGIYLPSAGCNDVGSDHFTASWTQGSTDHGSSGGGFFKTATDQFIGQVHCGVVCSSATRFGRFADFYPVVDQLLAVGSDDSLEDNDACGGLPDVSTGTYSNLIVKGVDDDWYEISVPAGAKITVELGFQHAWGDVDATLWVNCGDSTATDISASITNEETLEWINTGTAANTVAWRVYLYSDERASYDMTIRLDPLNETCATAQTIADGATVLGTNVNATHTLQGGCDNTATALDVWYRYVPPVSGILQLHTVDSDLDTVISIYGSCGGSELACNDDAPNGSPVGNGTLASYLAASVIAGSDYYIRVAGYNATEGWFRLHAETNPGAPYCLGDGVSGIACPCGNTSPTANEAGCRNSAGTYGKLAATGDADVSNDTLVLRGSGMPVNSSCLYFQGSAKTAGGSGVAFGDGLRCAAGTVIRLGTKTNGAFGSSSYPNGTDESISSRGNVGILGGTRYYQVWYRNAAVYCTPSTFNVSNGYQITWRP